MKIEQAIKDRAQVLGMDLCGIAPISRFANAPQGMHPTDFLPGCKSVVVVGVRLADGVVQTVMRNFEDGKRNAQAVYGVYGYTVFPNFQLAYSVYDLAQFIERNTKAAAMPTQTGPMLPGMSISQRHAAVAAGLGEFGWHSIIITPQFGTRNRFGAIMTTAELEPDPMYSGPKLCNPEKCGICTRVCPTGALSKYGEKEARRVVYPDKEGDKSYDYCHVSFARCRIAIHGLLKQVGGKADLVSSIEAPLSEVDAAVANNSSLDGGLQKMASWRCGRCLAYCPTGNWKEKFKDTGFSHHIPFADI